MGDLQPPDGPSFAFAQASFAAVATARGRWARGGGEGIEGGLMGDGDEAAGMGVVELGEAPGVRRCGLEVHEGALQLASLKPRTARQGLKEIKLQAAARFRALPACLPAFLPRDVGVQFNGLGGGSGSGGCCGGGYHFAAPPRSRKLSRGGAGRGSHSLLQPVLHLLSMPTWRRSWPRSR